MVAPTEVFNWLRRRAGFYLQIRLGFVVIFLALGWPLILPGILSFTPAYRGFQFNSMAGLAWVWIPAALVLLVGVVLCLVPGVRKWRVPVQMSGMILALFIWGSLCVAFEHGLDLTLRTVLLGSRAVPALLDVLAAESASSRVTPRSRVARNDLLFLGRRGVPRLLTALKNSDWSVRASAAGLLAQLGGEAASAEAALIITLKDPDERVSTAAADAVLRVAPSVRFNVPVLIDILNSGESLATVDAAIALAGLGPMAADAVPALSAGLKAKNWAMRLNAAEALGNIGPAAATAAPALTDALNDSEPRVRSAAAKALDRIKAQ